MANKFQEMLAAQRAGAIKLAAEGAGAAKVDVVAAINQVTGMQGSASTSVHNMPQQMVAVKGELDEEKAGNCLAVYEDNSFRPLKKVIKARGGKLVAVEGFFYAKLPEEVEVLEQYLAKKLVTKVWPQESEEA